MKDTTQKMLMGAFFVLMGVLILSAAFGVGPMSDAKMNAPRWIIAVCGLFFASGGVTVIAPTHKLAKVTAGVAVVSITVACAWIALFGDAHYFSGGLSMFSREVEVLMARILFASVAILGIIISGNAVRRALKG